MFLFFFVFPQLTNSLESSLIISMVSGYPKLYPALFKTCSKGAAFTAIVLSSHLFFHSAPEIENSYQLLIGIPILRWSLEGRWVVFSSVAITFKLLIAKVYCQLTFFDRGFIDSQLIIWLYYYY